MKHEQVHTARSAKKMWTCLTFIAPAILNRNGMNDLAVEATKNQNHNKVYRFSAPLSRFVPTHGKKVKVERGEGGFSANKYSALERDQTANGGGVKLCNKPTPRLVIGATQLQESHRCRLYLE